MAAASHASRYKRFLVGFLSLVAIASSVTYSAQGAVNLPGGSCFDARYFDGLSSVGDAGQCATAIKKAGFNGSALHNASAKTALIRLGLDGIFHFSGHSVSGFNEPAGATGLIFESPAPYGQMDILLGDPAGAIFQGPWTICSVNGGCRSGNIVSYPWAQLLAKFNLVVLQSCQTAKGSLAHPSIAQYAHLAGAGNVIGFGANTTSPSSWAGSFFGNIGNRVPYATAAASAGGACCGYGSWVLLTNKGAPTSLYPRGYYVPPMRIGVPGGPSAAASASADPRTASLERWLAQGLPSDVRWTADPGGDASVRQAYLPGTGLFQMDATTLEVTQAIFEAELKRPPAGHALDQTTARHAATRFAATHFPGFGGLTERSVERIDHGIYDEYRFSWQLQRGHTWLPSKVTVGLNSATGHVATYFSQDKSVSVSTTPRVSAEQARSAATRATRLTGSFRTSDPVLEVRVVRGTQQLVWVTELETVSTGGVFVPDYEVILTDAVSGQTKTQSN